jgi:hypothetical protein
MSGSVVILSDLSGACKEFFGKSFHQSFPALASAVPGTSLPGPEAEGCSSRFNFSRAGPAPATVKLAKEEAPSGGY